MTSTNMDITDTATEGAMSEKIELSMAALSDEGIQIIANDADGLLRGIADPAQAAAELRELANLIELHGREMEKEAA